MSMSPIRVVAVDDHRLYRAGLILALSAADDIAVVGEGETAIDAMSLAMLKAPDIALIDMNMPGGGIAAVTLIAMMRPATRSVIMTPLADEDAIDRARRAGAAGYILKGGSARDLIYQIRMIAMGGSSWPGDQAGLQPQTCP